MTLLEKRVHERCVDDAGEYLTLHAEDDQLIKGLIVDWSINGLAIVTVNPDLEIDVGDLLKYTPNESKEEGSQDEECIEYALARIHSLGDNIYLLGLHALS